MARLTSERMGDLLSDLCAAFGKPYGVSAKRMIDVYLRAVADYPAAAVEWAVAAASREGDKFPRPAKLRELCAKSPFERPGGTSLRDEMHAWEEDPWAAVVSLDTDRTRCCSSPCPVCGSVVEFSHRGAVIVHADRQHIEARISYSDLGRPEWLSMGPLPELPPRIKPPTSVLYFRTLEDSQRAKPPASPVGAGNPQWDAEQEARAAAARIA